MEKIILGNWKMNKTIEDTENYLKEFEKLDVPENIKVGIAFPYIDISTTGCATFHSNGTAHVPL